MTSQELIARGKALADLWDKEDSSALAALLSREGGFSDSQVLIDVEYALLEACSREPAL